MKKQLFAVFVSLCLIVSMLPVTVFAGEEQTAGIGAETVAECICTEFCSVDKVNKDCPVCGADGIDLAACKGEKTQPETLETQTEASTDETGNGQETFVSADTAAADSSEGVGTEKDEPAAVCTCETLCTEEEINADCPICSVEGAELDKVCVGAALLLTAPTLRTGEIELYVGGQQIKESGCYENQNGTWKKVDGTEPANGQFSYDAATATLTLNQAKIVNNQDVTVGGGFTYPGSVIAFSQSADVSLTIVVSQGTSNITGTGGIRVVSKAGDASLSISGPGSLEVNVDRNDSGITLIGSKNVNLNIDGADVKTLAAYYYGVDLHAGDGFKAAAVVNNGKLTAGGSGGIGIYYRWTNPSDSGTSSLTVSGNAVVDTRDSKILIASQASEVQVSAGSDGNGGIVFDGKSGTVYGDVTLQEDLEIGTDETLTIGKDASLTVPDGKILTNNGTIINNGTLTGEVGGSGTVTPKITTDSLPNGTVGEFYTATLEATGNNITWSASGLPDGLTLNSDGTITGTPTAEGTSTVTVKAENSAGSTSKDYTLNIKPATVPVTGVTLDKTTLELFTGNTALLTATVEPSNATNKNVTWGSSDNTVATVDNTGKVTAVKEGTANITATAEDGRGCSDACNVTVTQSVYSISADTPALDFGSKMEGYTEAPDAQMVTITNTGNQSVKVKLPGSTNYVITAGTGFQNDNAPLTPNGTAQFTVQPKTGLDVGSHSEMLTISGSNNTSATVELAFKVEPKPYLVTVNGSYAQTTGAGNYVKDATVTIDAGTRSGYTFDGWTSEDGVIFANAGKARTTFTMPEKAVTVTANWMRNPSYDYYIISASAGTGGSISPSGSISVREGLDKTFIIIPDSGWRISDVLVDGKSVGAVTSYTFDNVQMKHTIEATFKTINGIIIEEDGTIILPGEDLESTADDIRIEKGKGTENPIYVSDTESVIIKEGNQVILPSGDVVEPDAGSQVSIDGTITEPDGTVITSDGVTHRTDGAEVAYDGTVLKAAVPVIRTVEVSRNTPKVILNEQAYGAQGYDFVISTNKNCIVDKDYYQVNKDISETETDFVYVQKGVYYAYCHSWIKGADGKKTFSSWSEPYEFEITDITPEAPVIQSIKKNANGTITVTTVKGGPSYGYDIIFGTSLRKVNGEIRPVDYGNYVAKNRRKKTLTFPKLKPGTYYIAAHAFNAGENNQKVFSPWSNIRKIVIK